MDPGAQEISVDPPPKNDKRIIYIILLGLIGALGIVIVANYFLRKRQNEAEALKEQKRRDVEERRNLEDKLRDDIDIDISNIKSDKEAIEEIYKCLMKGKAYFVNVDSRKGTCGTLGFEFYFVPDERNIMFGVSANDPISNVKDIKRRKLLARLFTVNERKQSYLETLILPSRRTQRSYIENGREISNILANNKGELARLYAPFRPCSFSQDDFFDLEYDTPPDHYENIFVIRTENEKIFLTTTLYLKIENKDKKAYELFYLPDDKIPNLSNEGYLRYYRQPFESLFGKKQSMVKNDTIQDSKKKFVHIYPRKLYKNILDWEGKKFDFIYI